MGDLMEDHVAHFRLVVGEGEMDGKLDSPQGVAAETKCPLAPIECELPVVQPVVAHQRAR
jgi:uncharacterized membrane protein